MSSKFTIKQYDSQLNIEWDKFIKKSNNGTLFHRLDFLHYHGNRFSNNENHLLIYKGDTLHGVMPLAVFNDNGLLVAKSPYGASFGGPVFLKSLKYRESKEIVNEFIGAFLDFGFDKVIITMPLSIYHKDISSTFEFAMLEAGFKCIVRDISSVVSLSRGNLPDHFESRIRNKIKKANKLNVDIIKKADIKDFFLPFEKTFHKHDVDPTHTHDELIWLTSTLPDDIWVDVAYLAGEPVAGICYFRVTETVLSSFYLCQDPDRQSSQALTFLVSEALSDAYNQGFYYFDFGTSSFNMQARPNIFSFKEGFGSCGIFRETWELTVQ